MKRYFFASFVGVLVLAAVFFLVPFGEKQTEAVQTCQPLTCNTLEEQLGSVDYSIEKNKIYTVLIVDASKSMEGENLESTIKASKDLISQLEEHEQLAIVEFNEEAQILSTFTNEKFKLMGSIELIRPFGRTRFYEPFKIANDLFKDVPAGANKNIFFLSDGAPEDNEQTFLNEINSLKEIGVDIYTLAFAGKSNEDLMAKIATNTDNIFTVSSSEDIETKFRSIYNSINTVEDIDFSITKFNANQDGTEDLILHLFSSHNAKPINEDVFCDTEINTRLLVKQGNKQQEIRASFQNQEYHIPLSSLDRGTYELNLLSDADLDGCSLSGSAYLGELSIVEKKSSCSYTCDTIEELMTGNKNKTYIRENASISWVLLLDKSSSMSEQDLLEKAIEDIQTFVDIIPKKDSVSLIMFDRTSRIVVNHTTNKELIQNAVDEALPGAATKLHTALQLATQNSLESPYRQREIVIFSDGNFVDEDSKELKNTLKYFTGCISTVNYGTSLLQQQSQLFEIIQDERFCGDDIITRPYYSELVELAKVTQSTSPELALELYLEKTNASTTIQASTYSTFTKEQVAVENESCASKPDITLEVYDSKDNLLETRQLINTYTFNEGSYIKLSSDFGLASCTYSVEQTIDLSQIQQKDKKISSGKIFLTVIIVLIIHVITFFIVMKIKLKKLKERQSKI